MLDSDPVRHAIEAGDPAALEAILRANPHAANSPVVWELNRTNVSDPLHYISDCCFNDVLTNGAEATLARLLIAHGAAVDGRDGHEPPLIGATSLGVPAVAEVLIEAGADVHAISIFDAGALHWAAYMGLPTSVAQLLHHGADLEARCTQFGATPLFWAAQGFSRHGPQRGIDPLGAARVLVDAGARLDVRNNEGTSLLERAGDADSPRMRELIEARLGG